MTARRSSLHAIEYAIRDICTALTETRLPTVSWTAWTEDDLWREMVSCIVGSRVRYEAAHAAVERMASEHLFREDRRGSHFQSYEQAVVEALGGSESRSTQERLPFYRMRASQVRRAAEHIYGTCGNIRTFLERSGDNRDTRRRLASEVSGLGPKQASLFLRNVGYTSDIAILDTHVLAYMNWVGLIDEPVKSIPTLQKYEVMEMALVDRAQSFGVPPDTFDLAVWVVVRVAKQEDVV